MKTCSHPNCTNPVFSHSICKFHYRYIPKNKNKPKDAKKESQVELFMRVWNSRPHVSELSGMPLQNVFYKLNIFAHVLDKKNWPRFKYRDENIMIVAPEEHLLLDQGTERQREKYNETSPYIANWDLFYQKQKELKIKYRKLFS
jgi:hypothetical protein